MVGIFEVGIYEYDNGLALIHIDDAAKLYRLDGVSGVRLKLDDLFEAPAVARELAAACRWRVEVRDWTRSHANFFRAVQIEKRMMFIILTLIVAVAAFNIVSTLVMTVTDKQADIAILRTLGASPRSIMKIFMVQGALIGVDRHAARRGRRRRCWRSTSTSSCRRSSGCSTSSSSTRTSTTSATCRPTCSAPTC